MNMYNNNFGDMFQAFQAWNTFKSNHPKFPAFMRAVERDGIREGTVVEIKVTSPEGKERETNLKVTASDLALFDILRGTMQ